MTDNHACRLCLKPTAPPQHSLWGACPPCLRYIRYLVFSRRDIKYALTLLHLADASERHRHAGSRR